MIKDVLLQVQGFNKPLLSDILTEIYFEWSFKKEQMDLDKGVFVVWGQGELAPGETEEQFAHRMYKTVLKANKGSCRIDIKISSLDGIPFEIYTMRQEEADEILKELEEK